MAPQVLPPLPLHVWSYIYRLADKEAAATRIQAALRGLMQRRRRACLQYLVKYMAKGHDDEWQSRGCMRGCVHVHHVLWGDADGEDEDEFDNLPELEEVLD